MTKNDDKVIDWQAQLDGSEIGKDGNTEFVYLKGLQRLAKLKGIKSEKYPLIKKDQHKTTLPACG